MKDAGVSHEDVHPNDVQDHKEHTLEENGKDTNKNIEINKENTVIDNNADQTESATVTHKDDLICALSPPLVSEVTDNNESENANTHDNNTNISNEPQTQTEIEIKDHENKTEHDDDVKNDDDNQDDDQSAKHIETRESIDTVDDKIIVEKNTNSDKIPNTNGNAEIQNMEYNHSDEEVTTVSDDEGNAKVDDDDDVQVNTQTEHNNDTYFSPKEHKSGSAIRSDRVPSGTSHKI